MFNEHKIHREVDALVKLASAEYKNIDATTLEESARFKKSATILRATLKSIDADLLDFDELDGINNHLVSAVDQVSKFSNDQNIQALIDGNRDILIAIRQLKLMNLAAIEIAPQVQFRNIEEDFSRFAKAVDARIKDFDKAIENLESPHKAISDNFQGLESLVEMRRKEIEARFSDWQSQFSSAQNDRSRAFDELYQDIIEKNAATIGKTEQKSMEQITTDYKSWKAHLDNLLAGASEAHRSIQQLHNLSAEVSVTGGYLSNADKEGIAAVNWRRGSILFIVLAATWLIYSVFTLNSMIYWERAILSFPLTGVLLFGAAYAAQQASRHRDVEVRNRRFALEMAAIDPYLQSLDPADRQALKKELTRNYFGNFGVGGESAALNEKTTKQTLELVGQNIIKPLGDLFKIINKP